MTGGWVQTPAKIYKYFIVFYFKILKWWNWFAFVLAVIIRYVDLCWDKIAGGCQNRQHKKIIQQCSRTQALLLQIRNGIIIIRSWELLPHRHRVICWLLRPKLRRSKLIRCARGSSSKKRSTPSHISSKCGSYRRCSGTPAAAAGVLCLRRRRPPPPPPPPAWPSAGAPSGPARRKGPSCSSLVPRRREPSPVQLLVDCCARFHQEKKRSKQEPYDHIQKAEPKTDAQDNYWIRRVP